MPSVGVWIFETLPGIWFWDLELPLRGPSAALRQPRDDTPVQYSYLESWASHLLLWAKGGIARGSQSTMNHPVITFWWAMRAPLAARTLAAPIVLLSREGRTRMWVIRTKIPRLLDRNRPRAPG